MAARPGREEIRHIARLACLELRGAELDAMCAHMDRIIEAASTLQELETEGIPVYGEQAELTNSFREDHPKPSLPVERALQNAPARGPDGFEVPAIHD